MSTTVFPLRLELAEDAEQIVGLLGGQHAGGLVEDQDLGAAEQRLEDLDALLQADGEILDLRVGIDLEIVFALQPLQLRPRLGHAAIEQRAALGAEHNVFEDR
jgi:hypothetical protein